MQPYLEELLTRTERDSRVAVILLLLFFAGHGLNYWSPCSSSISWGPHLAGQNDRLTLNTVEQLIHGSAQQRSSSKRIEEEKQVFLSSYMEDLSFSHRLNTQSTLVAAV